MNEALRDWVANVHDTFYIIGTAAGPHPYPELVRDFQSVIGREARAQMLKRTGRLPDLLVAAIGGGSNAIGLFHPFLDDAEVAMLGVEAAGHGLDSSSTPPASPAARPASSTATRPICCRTRTARSPRRTRSAPGSTIPASAPSTPGCSDIGRVEYVSATDSEALDAFQLLCRTEGIIPALEPAHAIAAVAKRRARDGRRTQIILANLCGRGDKDIFTVADALGVEL